MSKLEDHLALLIRAERLPKPERELRFHKPTITCPRLRQWRFDFAWPQVGIACEVEGGIFGKPCTRCRQTGQIWIRYGGAQGKLTQQTCNVCGGSGQRVGRHVSGKGFQNDCEKYNEALVLGWRVLRVTSEMIDDGRAIAWLKQLLITRKGESL